MHFYNYYRYELFKHLPQQRSLSKEAKAKAAKLLEMKANRKMVQLEMSQETGNVVLLRDLSNIIVSQRKGKTRNDIDASVKLSMDKYGIE